CSVRGCQGHSYSLRAETSCRSRGMPSCPRWWCCRGQPGRSEDEECADGKGVVDVVMQLAGPGGEAGEDRPLALGVVDLGGGRGGRVLVHGSFPRFRRWPGTLVPQPAVCR